MTGRRKQRLRILLLVSVGVLASAAGLLGHFGGVLDQPELDTVDTRFDLRGREAPPEDIVVVQIDDVTFGELRERFPFPRSLHAKAVDRLREYGARTIAYDVQFTEPTEPGEDEALIESLRRSGKAVLATTEVSDDGRSNVLGGAEAMEFARVRDADATLRPDKGGVIRSFPYSPQGLKSFAVVAAEAASGRKVDPGRFDDDSAWIAYHGPPRTLRRVSFSRLVNGKVRPADIRGKIAVVGATAPSLQDVRPTSSSGSELMPGAEIQANAISTILRDFPLREAPGFVDAFLIVLMGVAGPLLGGRQRPLSGTAFAIALGAAYLGVSYLLFTSGTIVPVIAPLAALALGGFGALAVHYSLAALEREHVRMLFSRFVPEDVVNDLVHRADGARLGGVAYDSTVLFSDIRGFTSYSEGKEPDLVLKVLNRYHGEMCEALFSNGGTLISYIGDGIMAVFGVPLAQDDHADRALLAARAMVGEHLERFNEWMRGEGLGEGFKMGVGLNSGPVTAGNIGSERRLEYTAIGDTVNTASRLEGMTKGTPHDIFLSDTTRKRLAHEPDDLVLHDDLEVRGRVAKVKVWGVAAGATVSEMGSESYTAHSDEWISPAGPRS